MNNFEIMKQDILSQIENLNIQQFYDFLSLLTGEVPDNIDTLINTQNMFKCIDCEKLYGKCNLKKGVKSVFDNDYTDECFERFKIYSDL